MINFIIGIEIGIILTLCGILFKRELKVYQIKQQIKSQIKSANNIIKNYENQTRDTQNVQKRVREI